MGKYILLLICLVAFGCEELTSPYQNTETNSTQPQDSIPTVLEGYELKTFNGCQYLEKTVFPNGGNKGYGYVTHKGDCNNPIHQYQLQFRQ